MKHLKPITEKKPKGAPDWHDSDAPDANGRFRDLSPKKLAAWLIKTRKKDVKRISGSLTQQVVFNRNEDPEYAKKMERTRKEVYKQLGRKDLLARMDEMLDELQSNIRIHESDDADEMAYGQLEKIIDYAHMIRQRLENGEELDDWMYGKIIKAEDYLNTLADVIDGDDGVIESEVNEKILLIMKDVISKMVGAGFSARTNPKMRDKIYDAISKAIVPILKDYGYAIKESKDSDELAAAINNAIIDIDDSMSYKDFAEAVAKVIRDEYGSHLYKPFQKQIERSLKESLVNEKDSPYQKADRLAGDMFGEMGLFNLAEDELDQIIDLKKANKLAKKQYGEFGFKTLSARDMEELLDANPKLLRESVSEEKVNRKKLSHDLWDRKGYDYKYLDKLSDKKLKALWDTEFYYESVSEANTAGEDVWNHIVNITPEEDDIPWGFQDKIEGNNFKLTKVDLKKLLKSDPDFAAYYKGGEERYDQDEVDEFDVYNELVVVKGELLDGYSRAARLLRQGEKKAHAFVAESSVTEGNYKIKEIYDLIAHHRFSKDYDQLDKKLKDWVENDAKERGFKESLEIATLNEMFYSLVDELYEAKPGPDAYMTGLSDEEEEAKKAKMKKQAAMDDDDPDSYEELPGDKEAREEGKVKKSKHTTAYHKKFKKESMKNIKSFDSFIIEERLDEGVMSDIHLMIQQHKSFDSFQKEFFKEYGHKKVMKKTPEFLEWLKALYKDFEYEYGNTVEERYDKKKLLKALKNKDDAFILVRGQEYIVYNPDNGNQDNADMWGDKTIFALDQDGEEHEIRYKDIERVSEGLKFGAKNQYSMEDVNEAYGFWGTLEVGGFTTREIEDCWLSAHSWLTTGWKFTDAGALYFLNAKIGRWVADKVIERKGYEDVVDVLEDFATSREWKKWSKEYNNYALEVSELKKMSNKDWKKIKKFNKHVTDSGEKFVMSYDDRIGTFLEPVEIVEEKFKWETTGDKDDKEFLKGLVQRTKAIYGDIKPAKYDLNDFDKDLDKLLKKFVKGGDSYFKAKDDRDYGTTNRVHGDWMKAAQKVFRHVTTNTAWRGQLNTFTRNLSLIWQVHMEAEAGRTGNRGYKVHKRQDFMKNLQKFESFIGEGKYEDMLDQGDGHVHFIVKNESIAEDLADRIEEAGLGDCDFYTERGKVYLRVSFSVGYSGKEVANLKKVEKLVGMKAKAGSPEVWAADESIINEEKAEGDRGKIDDDAIETGLKNKSDETGVPIALLRIVMRRGMAAWKTGHRPGATQQQWGYARVNSFLTKQKGTWGGADKDVAKEVRDGGHDKKL